MTLGPVLVTVEAPMTPKLAAAPKMVSAYDRLPAVRMASNSAARSIIFIVVLLLPLSTISVTFNSIPHGSTLGGGPPCPARASWRGGGPARVDSVPATGSVTQGTPGAGTKRPDRSRIWVVDVQLACDCLAPESSLHPKSCSTVPRQTPISRNVRQQSPWAAFRSKMGRYLRRSAF